MKNASLLYLTSHVFKVLLIKSYMIELDFRWVLIRGLEARGNSREIVRVEKNLWDYSSFFIKQNAA